MSLSLSLTPQFKTPLAISRLCCPPFPGRELVAK
jgi:hypothetical protein